VRLQQAIKIYVIPAAVCQSVVVGGGYGTGREVVEFLSDNGARGGIAAILVYALLVSLVIAITFEFARRFNAYDYRTFFRRLIGRAWILYEGLVVAGLLLILAVTGSAAGTILNDGFGVPIPVGVGIVLIAVVALTYYGRDIVEKSLTIWAVLVTGVIAYFSLYVFVRHGASIAASFAQSTLEPGWLQSGTQFGLNNSALMPLLLYCATDIKTRHQALLSGVIAGLATAFPGLAFHVSFMAAYPAVLEQPLPTYWMIQQLAIPYFLPIYVIVLFGTIAQTGVGVLQGLNERLDGWLREIRGRPLGPVAHATVAGSALLLSLGLASFGVVTLVAKGYGNAAWVSLAIFQLPLLTVGVYKLWARPPPKPPDRLEA